MLVEHNSVWQFDSVDEFSNGLYRVLTIYPEKALFIVFPLMEEKQLMKPLSINQSHFLASIQSKSIIQSELELPFYLNQSDEISSKYWLKRDEQYQLIKGIIEDPYFLFDLTTNQRSKRIAEHARSMNTYVQKLYRILNSYWRFGQHKDALIPAYKLSGAPGKLRQAGENKRGRPVEFNLPSMSAFQGVNTSKNDQKFFVKAMRKYALRGQEAKFSRVYKQMLDEFYADELINAEEQKRSPNIPTYRNFIYWTKKLIPENEIIKKQTNQGDFDRNHRGLRGSATDHTSVIGSCFELDATVLDVHVVSEFQRNHVIGRPTFYSVVDKESRMIVGIHLSMEYASWRAGRQALVNSFSPKKAYCARFCLDINEEDWPCYHVPQRLLCDRGEFICKNAEQLAVPLIGHLSIAPPYRPDHKGIVEHRFKILNDDLIHELMGTTRGRHYVRGDKDPRLEAALTLTEVTKLLIDAVMAHNNRIFDSLFRQSTLLIENDLTPTPINYWNIHRQKHRHALSVVDEATLRARLLPVEILSMTSRGVRLNDEMYYEAVHPKFEDWKILARSKRWKLEARIDQDDSSFIYVKFDEKEKFIKCYLMKMSSNFREKHSADVLFFADWKKAQKSTISHGKSSVEIHERRKNTVAQAKDALKNAEPLASKRERTKDMKQRRKDAILEGRLESKNTETIKIKLKDDDNQLDVVKEKNKKIISILKRRNKT